LHSLEPFFLTGLHVRLEPLSSSQVDALVAAAGVSRAHYAVAFVPATLEAMAAYVREALDDQAAGTALAFATVDVRSERIVGSTRYMNIERWRWPAGSELQRPPERPDAVEIGATWLAHDMQRTALNTEAKLLMLSHAFERWDVHRVTIKTDVRNLRSRAAIERLGATLDGILRSHSPSATGTVRDTAYYSILKAEWPDVRERLETRLAR
jgi:RimJ/RimL family protein N-acetyltransferase